MIEHCNMKFRPDVIWFLKEKGLFTNRRLEIGVCPNCERQVVRFVETRVTDGKVFDDTFKKRKADKCIKENEKDILYTSLDSVQTGKKNLFGFRYGENTERYNKKTGETTIIQKACDWYGNKEIVKKENI